MSTLAATNLKNASSASNNIVLDSSGRALIGVSSANANGGILQLSSGITFPATQVLSTDPNTLDDYEEGTWTPTVVGSTTPGTATYSIQSGAYTKIGNQVTVRFYLSYTGGTGSGNLRVSGLPFTSSSASNSHCFTAGVTSDIALTAGHVSYFGISPNVTFVTCDSYPTGGGTATSVAYDAAGAMGVCMSYFV